MIGYASPKFGRAGLELAYDAELAGLAGDPLADALRKFGSDPYDPKDLQLALSWDLQRAAIRALGNRRGAIVMIDPRNGEVLALASTPVYDASLITNPATADASFEALRKDKDQPLLPRATLGRYVPGSVFKIVTAIAGLGSNAISPATTYKEQPAAEQDGLRVQGFRIRDGHHPQTGDKALDFVEATEVSCNIWFALTGLRTGGDELVDYAAKLGFGAPIPFDLPTAVSQVTNGSGNGPGGFVDDVELANAAYGQGETFVTPLQMALVAATVANRRRADAPAAGHGAHRQGRDAPDRAAIDPACHRPRRCRGDHRGDDAGGRGPARAQFTTGAKVPGITTAGKSGTAELGGKGEPHSWFIGFAPAEQPTIAIAVLVEQAGRGAEVAAPIAGDLMTLYLQGGA